MKEENIKVNYKTIDIVEQRGLLEITRDLGRLLTEEEFEEIMMVYKKVIDRQWNELEKNNEWSWLDDFKRLLKKSWYKKDGDKMLLWCDYVNTKDGEVIGWSNLEIDIKECDIRLLPSRNNSPFSSEN